MKKNVAVVMDELSLMVLVVDLLLVLDVKVCLPRPRSSRRSNLLAASLKAVRPFLEGTQSSKPNAARRCSDVTNVVVAPDRIHACFPTFPGQELPSIHEPRFLAPRLVRRQKAQA